MEGPYFHRSDGDDDDDDENISQGRAKANEN